MKAVTMSACAVLAIAAGAAAQEPQEMVRRQALEAQAVMARMPLDKITTGAPYSADLVIENTQALADGNRIARRTTGKVYRDTQGRTRRDQDNGNGRVSIAIVDPVAGVSYQLDPVNMVAWKTPSAVGSGMLDKLMAEKAVVEGLERSKTTEVRARGGDAGAVATPGSPEVGVAVARGGARGRGEGLYGGAKVLVPDQPIEHKTIDGIPVDGHRMTVTIPAGQIGNEQPLTIVTEEWSSPDLQVLVMTHHTDPRTGESNYRLSNIVRGEPDPSLFSVPAGYEIRETGIRRQQK